MKHSAQLGQFCIATQYKICCTFFCLWHVLGHLSQTPLLGNGEVATVLMQSAIEKREKGGFACAIAANQANALSGFKRKLCVVQQSDVPKCELGVL